MKTVTFNDLQPGQILAVIIWPDSPGHYSSGVFGAVIDDGDDWEERFVQVPKFPFVTPPRKADLERFTRDQLQNPQEFVRVSALLS